MPNPRIGDVHVNRPLTNISIAYTLEHAKVQYAAAQVFPIVPVNNQSDGYFLYTKADWLRAEARIRAPGAESAGAGYNIDNTNTYSCDVWAVHKDVDDQTRSNTDIPLDADRDAAIYVTQQLLLRRDLEWQSAFFATSVWTGSTTGTDLTTGDYTAWDNPASTPIQDVAEEANAIQQSTGFRPNVLVLAPKTYLWLQQHPDIVDRVKYTGDGGFVTYAQLARAFGVEKIVVPTATRNTAAEGTTVSMSHVFSRSALLVYAAPAPSLMHPSGGYIFNWAGYTGTTSDGFRIKKFRIERLESDRVEGSGAWDMKVTAADAGAFFSNIVAA